MTTRTATPISLPRGSLLIIGTGFADFGDILCAFGGARTPGRLVHSGAILCNAPPAIALRHYNIPAGRHALPGAFARTAEQYPPPTPPPFLPVQTFVEVCLNGVHCTRGSGVYFTWYNLSKISLSAVSPTSGPSAGIHTVSTARCQVASARWRGWKGLGG